MNVLKKIENEVEGEPAQKVDAAFGIIFRTRKCFQEARRNFIFLKVFVKNICSGLNS